MRGMGSKRCEVEVMRPVIVLHEMEMFLLFDTYWSQHALSLATRLDTLTYSFKSTLVPNKRPFQSVFMSECRCIYTLPIVLLVLSDRHVQGLIIYSNQFHY